MDASKPDPGPDPGHVPSSPDPGAPPQAAVPAEWTRRILAGATLGLAVPPAWLARAYERYRATLEAADYPCFFGQAAERNREMFYAFCARSPDLLLDSMRQFIALGGDEKYRRFSLAVFVEPDAELLAHEDYVRRFWDLLRYLNEHDGTPMVPADPDDPFWEFSFGGRQMFVVGTSPTYRQRRSRVLADGMVLLFQPRGLFVDPATQQPISAAVRRRIHARMLAYDGMPVHPDIGFYGDPDNREWKQYVLPDDNAPETGRCPFRAKPRR
ncbi:YqcI/YcgG family protein [Cupriavidus sp. 30B13]|uniref:YqcI/YcgG family protein n=1 Tax=Cupriavidus sp. 30B13 TaxID=3384241 RepID=UPI003B8FCB3B